MMEKKFKIKNVCSGHWWNADLNWWVSPDQENLATVYDNWVSVPQYIRISEYSLECAQLSEDGFDYQSPDDDDGDYCATLIEVEV